MYNCYIMIGLMFLKELMLIKPIKHINVLLLVIIYFLEVIFRFIYDGFHDLRQKAKVLMILQLFLLREKIIEVIGGI